MSNYRRCRKTNSSGHDSENVICKWMLFPSPQRILMAAEPALSWSLICCIERLKHESSRGEFDIPRSKPSEDNLLYLTTVPTEEQTRWGP